MRPREQDSEATAVPVLQNLCHEGFTTCSCHMGTAPVGRAAWHWSGMVKAAACASRLVSGIAGVPGRDMPAPALPQEQTLPLVMVWISVPAPPSAVLHINPPGSS